MLNTLVVVNNYIMLNTLVIVNSFHINKVVLGALKFLTFNSRYRSFTIRFLILKSCSHLCLRICCCPHCLASPHLSLLIFKMGIIYI